MGLLKKRKNKKYSYEPRYYTSNKEGSPFGIEHKFDKYRSTVGDSKGLKGKFTDAMADFKGSANRRANKTILVIIGILLLLFLYLIDFDLTIFTTA